MRRPCRHSLLASHLRRSSWIDLFAFVRARQIIIWWECIRLVAQKSRRHTKARLLLGSDVRVGVAPPIASISSPFPPSPSLRALRVQTPSRVTRKKDMPTQKQWACHTCSCYSCYLSGNNLTRPTATYSTTKRALPYGRAACLTPRDNEKSHSLTVGLRAYRTDSVRTILSIVRPRSM